MVVKFLIMDVQATIENGFVIEVFYKSKPAQRIDIGSRQVFKSGNHFIKFDGHPSEACYPYQSRLEIEVAETICELDEPFFCMPIEVGVIDGLSYVVQEEVVPATDTPTPNDIERLNEIIEAYALAGDVGASPFGGWHNCMWTKDGFKIYDYALMDGNTEEAMNALVVDY